MSNTAVVRRNDSVAPEPIDAAEGLHKAVLIDDSDGAPHFSLRRFVLEPGANVPEHTNTVEHEQYVLAGEYVVGIGDEEYTVGPGDALLIPAGTVHWYRNDGEQPGEFLCIVPNEPDSIQVVESSRDEE